jgi:hypothetical protein
MGFKKIKNQIAYNFYSLQLLSNTNSMLFYFKLRENVDMSDLTDPKYNKAISNIDALIETKFNSAIKNGRKADEYGKMLGFNTEMEQKIKAVQEKYHNSRLNDPNEKSRQEFKEVLEQLKKK